MKDLNYFGIALFIILTTIFAAALPTIATSIVWLTTLKSFDLMSIVQSETAIFFSSFGLLFGFVGSILYVAEEIG